MEASLYLAVLSKRQQLLLLGIAATVSPGVHACHVQVSACDPNMLLAT